MNVGFLGDIVLQHSVSIGPRLKTLLKRLDRVVINIEGLLIHATPYKQKTHGCCLSSEKVALLNTLDELSVTDVVVYNNHAFDLGEVNFLESVETFIQSGYNVLQKEGCIGNLRYHVFGLPEFAGGSEEVSKYGYNISKNHYQKVDADSVVIAHFGIEQVRGLSQFELDWFKWISSQNPAIVIRHHPHSVQPPFVVSETPIFPSIGDSVFQTNFRNAAAGQLVIYDSNRSRASFVNIKFNGVELELIDELSDRLERNPTMLTIAEKENLVRRYISEYKISAQGSFRAFLKHTLRKEDPSQVMRAVSTDYIQPYIINEIL